MSDEETKAENTAETKNDAAHIVAGIRRSGNVAEPLLMSKASILQTADREYRTVNVTKWWGTKQNPVIVRVQSLTAGERDEWEASYVQHRKDGSQRVTTNMIRAGLVARSLVDANNVVMFSAEEAAHLQAKHAGAIDAIYTECAEMNGVTDADIEEIQGNSGSGPSAAT